MHNRNVHGRAGNGFEQKQATQHVDPKVELSKSVIACFYARRYYNHPDGEVCAKFGASTRIVGLGKQPPNST